MFGALGGGGAPGPAAADFRAVARAAGDAMTAAPHWNVSASDAPPEEDAVSDADSLEGLAAQRGRKPAKAGELVPRLDSKKDVRRSEDRRCAAGLRRAVRSSRAWPSLRRVGDLVRRTLECVLDQHPKVLHLVAQLRTPAAESDAITCLPREVVAEARHKLGEAIGWGTPEWERHGFWPSEEQRQRSPIHGDLLARLAYLAGDPDPEPARWVITSSCRVRSMPMGLITLFQEALSSSPSVPIWVGTP